MELNKSTSHATSGAKVTSHYWGYRELSFDETAAVAGGGDFSGDGFDSSSNGGSGNSNATGNQAAAATANAGTNAEQALALAYQTQAITAGPRNFNAPVSQGGSVLGSFFGSYRAGTVGPTGSTQTPSPSPNYDAFGNQQGGGTSGSSDRSDR